jgi:hypothetical protein
LCGTAASTTLTRGMISSDLLDLYVDGLARRAERERG